MKIGSYKYAFAFAVFAGLALFAAGFSLLWVRSSVAGDAKEIAVLEYRLLKVQDELRTVEVKVDDSVQPHVLRARVDSFLRIPEEGQVIRFSDVEAKSNGNSVAYQQNASFRKEGV